MHACPPVKVAHLSLINLVQTVTVNPDTTSIPKLTNARDVKRCVKSVLVTKYVLNVSMDITLILRIIVKCALVGFLLVLLRLFWNVWMDFIMILKLIYAGNAPILTVLPVRLNYNVIYVNLDIY